MTMVSGCAMCGSCVVRLGARECERERPDAGRTGGYATRAARGLRAGVFRINGVNSASVEVASVVPDGTKPDTREALIERQRREFVMNVFSDRLRTQMTEGLYSENDLRGLSSDLVSPAAMPWPGRTPPPAPPPSGLS